MSAFQNTADRRRWAIWLNRVVYRLSRLWLLPISFLILVYVGLPWAAPLFMEIGWTSAGKAIYLLYASQCHQLPQRSFFLFGNQSMYSLAQVQSTWQNSSNPNILRQFIGDPATGWKVAWSDRMVFMYTTILLWGALFWLVRKRLKPLPWWGLLLFLIPMALDGFTHMISDFTGGIGLGFRYSNAWLATLTNDAFPVTFYSGDAFGSFNSWMRLVTGMLFGLGIVWTFYPRLHSGFTNTANKIEDKFRKAGLET
ncbi:MAG TPA: DUF2085 domain-containing protein [candidate division Zixibacteria bacterium]|nr:DUF2085 domain-containing protein [candidate division Zixibacteria bacterium]